MVVLHLPFPNRDLGTRLPFFSPHSATPLAVCSFSHPSRRVFTAMDRLFARGGLSNCYNASTNENFASLFSPDCITIRSFRLHGMLFFPFSRLHPSLARSLFLPPSVTPSPLILLLPLTQTHPLPQMRSHISISYWCKDGSRIFLEGGAPLRNDVTDR